MRTGALRQCACPYIAWCQSSDVSLAPQTDIGARGDDAEQDVIEDAEAAPTDFHP